MPHATYSMTCVAPTVTRALGLRDLADATGEPIIAFKHCDFQRAMTEDDVLD